MKFGFYTILVLLPLMSSCHLIQKEPENPNGISEDDLRSALGNYEKVFIAKVRETSRELDQRVPTLENRHKTIMLRDQLISACRAMLEQKETLAAYADSWVLAVRLVEFFKSGHGSELFGEHQEIVINTSEENLEHIEKIGGDFFDEEAFVKSKSKIYEFARKHPIGENYTRSVTYASKSQQEGDAKSGNIFSLPIAPFGVVEGFSQSMMGTRKLANTAEHFSDIIEDMPESIRWQLMLLLSDMEKMDTIKSVADSMAEFSKSSVRFADSTEKLPEQLRKEMSVLIDQVDAKQANLQATIDRVGAIVDDVDGLTRNINFRAMQLVVLIFVLAIAYRIVASRLACRPGKEYK